MSSKKGALEELFSFPKWFSGEPCFFFQGGVIGFISLELPTRKFFIPRTNLQNWKTPPVLSGERPASNVHHVNDVQQKRRQVVRMGQKPNVDDCKVPFLRINILLSCIEKCSFHKGYPLVFWLRTNYTWLIRVSLQLLWSNFFPPQLRLRFDQIWGWIFRGSNRNIPNNRTKSGEILLIRVVNIPLFTTGFSTIPGGGFWTLNSIIIFSWMGHLEYFFIDCSCLV